MRDIGGLPVAVPEAERTLYHAALAHAANHLVTLVVQASAMLREAGVDTPAEVMRPLLRAALDNALARGPSGATGPVVRGDAGAVQEHLQVIAQRTPEAAAAYRQMSLAGVRVALAEGRITAAQAERLSQVLERSA